MTTQAELKTLTALRASAVTGGLANEHLKKMATMAQELEFAEDEIIYNTGELGKAVYIVQQGEVVIEMPVLDDTWVPVLVVGPGELFGWSSLFASERKRARARTTEPTHLLAIDSVALRNAWQNDEDLQYAIIHLTSEVMIDRIKATRQRLVEALTA